MLGLVLRVFRGHRSFTSNPIAIQLFSPVNLTELTELIDLFQISNASTDDSIRSRANVNSTSQFNRAVMIATLQSMAESHAIYRAPISIWVHLILSFVVAFIHSLVFGTKISRCLIASRRTWIAGAIISTAPTLVPSTG